MDQLMPNTVEASGEKHVPAVIVTGDAIQVHVGTVNHPMAQEHWISWIQLETSRGSQRKYLKPGEAPKAVFAMAGEEP
ncbi:desulfoferrodoxin family protein, partial [Acinetobacter baumannii]|nr:desulfoferrodoxin family protein [Acinetobacter baumannii]